MKNELKVSNKSAKPILDKEGNKIGETKTIERQNDKTKEIKSISHASKVTKNGKVEMFSESYSYESEE